MAEPTVAVLGTGIMGAAMARNLLRAGMSVRAWDRTRPKAEPLVADGAVVCDEPGEAAAGAEIVLTMLYDGRVVEEVMAGVLPAMEENAVWVQSSTVGPAAADALAELARRHDVPYFDAPVLGTRLPAEKGELTVVAAGPVAARDEVLPVLDAVGSRTIWVGETTEASRLKLVLNDWVLALTASLGEVVALAEAFGLDPRMFLDAISGGPLDVGYAHAKAELILSGDFAPSFKAETAAKDATLVTEAAREAGLSLLVAEAVREQMVKTVHLGHGEEDMAAVYHAARSS
ncbi:NAD(P)-dependent oxidoreductase [Actinomadura scrupuli]|uniref:NAD(P)-dependent oxidoreductase n=1 Tax=Actinomadura scrupuli TaxID=559629 RepID=UPI003D9886A7